ncbi:hypothetical protein [Deinococcus yavapaiensis]|uniref:Uncharacterized protein n=1 Tax=Deinococcus yavapaiensis KR-236 TaxID=694435 RepID=A0A318SQ97_9DEIO|nr:hypothetical protein [Deinococcus yavapaiensis]PYE54943.1 hypothetical protein DES52_104217 [Deinococcus yavapaiensis KR-236]
MDVHRLAFSLDHRIGHVLRREDGGMLTLQETLPVFEHPEDADRYALDHALHLTPAAASPVQLDVLALWLSRDRVDISHDVLLHAWELFAAVARSLKSRDSRVVAEFEGPGCLYDKLFWTSVTPGGALSVAERAKLRWVLAEGLRSFRGALSWQTARDTTN